MTNISKGLNSSKTSISGMKPKWVIYGAGDNGGKIAYEHRNLGKYNHLDLVGFLDDRKKGEFVGLPILGGKKDLKSILNEGIDHVLVTTLEDSKNRLERCLEMEEMGYKFPSFHGYLPPETKVGKGVFIYDNATLLGFDQEIDDFSIIGPYVTLEGRTKLGKGTVLCPYSFVGHNAEIGDATTMYPRSTCLPYTKIGKECKIGHHSIAHKEIKDGKTIRKY